jgi:hypothetical protein
MTLLIALERQELSTSSALGQHLGLQYPALLRGGESQTLERFFICDALRKKLIACSRIFEDLRELSCIPRTKTPPYCLARAFWFATERVRWAMALVPGFGALLAYLARSLDAVS